MTAFEGPMAGAMTHQVDIPDDQDDAGSSKLALRLIFAGLAMMTFAGFFMWWKFGPSMFMTLLTAAANCF